MERATLDDIAETWRTLMGISQALELSSTRKLRGSPVPLTIIGGFLGSGKTTLLNGLITGAHGLRIVAIVNDFGTVNVDAALTRDRNAGVIELTNGCACCSIAGGLINGIDRALSASLAPDAIVIESSGVGDPGSIAHIVSPDERVRLNAVLSTVDATSILEMEGIDALRSLVSRQLSAADFVILTKVDLVPFDRKQTVLRALTTRYPSLRIIDGPVASLPESVLLQPAVDLRKAQASGRRISVDPFVARTIAAEEQFDAERLCGLLDHPPGGFLRAKGYLKLGSAGVPHLLQAVGKRWSLTELRRPNPPEAYALTVIGLLDCLDADGFADDLRRCQLSHGSIGS